MKTILALVDFSDVSLKVLNQVQVLAQAFKSHVTILHGIPMMPLVVDSVLGTPMIPQEQTAVEIQADLARLEMLTEPLRKCGVDVSLKQFHGLSIEQISQEALQFGADLIVVGSHHHNSLYNLLVGSVTHNILMGAKCPVLAVSAD